MNREDQAKIINRAIRAAQLTREIAKGRVRALGAAYYLSDDDLRAEIVELSGGYYCELPADTPRENLLALYVEVNIEGSPEAYELSQIRNAAVNRPL